MQLLRLRRRRRHSAAAAAAHLLLFLIDSSSGGRPPARWLIRRCFAFSARIARSNRRLIRSPAPSLSLLVLRGASRHEYHAPPGARAIYSERGGSWTGHGFSLQSLLTPGRLDGGARARPGAARRHGRGPPNGGSSGKAFRFGPVERAPRGNVRPSPRRHVVVGCRSGKVRAKTGDSRERAKGLLG